jgi:type VI protein secretion system component VasF
MTDEQRRFLDRARASLEARSQQLPPTLEGRLRAARRSALAPSRRFAHRAWLPAMATAALVAVVVALSWFSRPLEEPGLTLAQLSLDNSASDFDMLTRDEPLELYQDLEFYYWLEQGGEHAG